jgi:hypothetical protein
VTRLALFIICLLCVSGCEAKAAAADLGVVVASSSDETAEQRQISEKVQVAIAADDFATLDTMEKDYRSSRARTPSGLWKLGVYHAALQAYLADGVRRESGCQYRKADFVRRWEATASRNPASTITDAALLEKQAFCFRGEEFASKVPDEAWAEVSKDVSAADEMLENGKVTASVDPEYYAVKLKVMMLQGVSKVAFRHIIDEATDREPYYNRIYSTAVFYFLPNWGGSYPEVEAFARYAAERTRSSHGGGYYARVFWELDSCGCGFLDSAVNWSTMKRAMRDVYERYPVSWNGQYFADLSCRLQDGEEGRHYLRAIHPEAPGDVFFIGMFAYCDRQHLYKPLER